MKVDFNRKMTNKDFESGNMFSDLENAMWKSKSKEEYDPRSLLILSAGSVIRFSS